MGIEAASPEFLNLKDALPWELLAKSTHIIKDVYIKEVDLYEYHEYPTYPDEIKKLEGTKVRVRGFAMVNDDEPPFKTTLITPIKPAGCGHYHGPGNLLVEAIERKPLEKKPNGTVTYEGILELPDDPSTSWGIYYQLLDAVQVPISHP